ncbi:F-box domain-containing protein [Artemisia annua]|uniref:F-box domain-containing protein n=1 Tax=Artemisia annua TaxID=35608 RepID=A0A2U1NCM8_ARTAN|nr:F-box domain-containing protein [Artemisia annua]
MGSLKRPRDEKITSRKLTATVTTNIPDDVLWDIFTRLPAKHLARMRCLSKPWNALLSQPSFIQAHLDRSIHNNDDKILFVFDYGYPSNTQSFVTHPSRSSILRLPNLVELPDDILSCDLSEFIGSVNGLLCFSIDHSINIWNPSLSASTTFSSITSGFDDYDDYYDRHGTVFRFGFDPKNDDYKVVKLMYIHDEFEDIVKGSIKIEVYSLGKRCWESVNGFPSHITKIYDNDEICLDGHVYWRCEIDPNSLRETIVSFDLGLETFYEIPLPENTQGPDVENLLGVTSNKLCLISRVPYGDCEVWVMDAKYNGWVKHQSFPQFDGDIIPICFTPNNLFLFQVDERLALYDPDAAAVKLLISNIPHDNYKIVQYVDSLVWVPPAPKHVCHH